MIENGGFEELTNCPNEADQFDFATHWDTLRAGGGGGPDYLNSCSQIPAYGVPLSIYGYQPARDGEGYIAFCCYASFADGLVQREYIQGELSMELEAGKSYCVTFYASLSSWYSHYAVDRLGAYLDDGSMTTTFYGPANVVPQIETMALGSGGTYLNDTLNWIKIQGVLVANGTEKYITLGNFRNHANTQVVQAGSCLGCTGANYYFDDVSVIEINSQANAGPDQTLYIGDSVFIGIPEIGDEFTWYANGVPFYTGSEAGLWVTPGETTTYVCEQHVCNVVTRDTVVVTVTGIGLDESKSESSLALYPNPTTGFVYLKASQPAADGYQIRAVDAAGRELNKQFVKDDEAIYLPELSGIYLLEIKNVSTGESCVSKVEVRR